MPTIAQAHRAPTPRERSQTRHAAILAEGGPRLRIAVTDIRVSTVDAWATATVTTYPKAKGAKPEMVAEDTFLKAHGKWLDTDYYLTPDRTPPNAVVADLGLPANPSKSKSNHTVEIIGAVAIGLLALMVLGRSSNATPARAG